MFYSFSLMFCFYSEVPRCNMRIAVIAAIDAAVVAVAVVALIGSPDVGRELMVITVNTRGVVGGDGARVARG